MNTRRTFGVATLAAACLLVAAGATARPAAADVTAAVQAANDIVAFFKAYDAAFTAKDLEKLATMYHADVTVYEGGGINTGWVDYRDRHLGPELKSFNNLTFGHGNVKVQMLGADAAYVTADYTLGRTVNEKEVRSGGLATYIVIRHEGRWVIRHSHTSSRRVPAGGGLF